MMMSLKLPAPVETYFTSENAHDPSALDKCFASNAVVHDEGGSIEGIASIRAWRTETAKKYNHSVEPIAVSYEGSKTIVTVRVTGNFPGSPINLSHIFELDGDRIISLKIR
jgi:hypothetical protein